MCLVVKKYAVRVHLRAALCYGVSSIPILLTRLQTFRLVADAGLEDCLEEGLAAVFFVAALAVEDLLSRDLFVLDADIFEAGFFPVTS